MGPERRDPGRGSGFVRRVYVATVPDIPVGEDDVEQGRRSDKSVRNSRQVKRVAGQSDDRLAEVIQTLVLAGAALDL